MVIGSPGAGKSTFSKRLAAETGLPLTHLDDHFWLPNWKQRYTSEEWDQTLRAMAAEEAWILDGNYTRTLEIRAERADHLIVLAAPRFLCLYRVITRAWFNRRPDRDVLDRESFDLEFLRFIWNFPRTSRRQMERLAAYPQLKTTILRNERETTELLASLKSR